MATDEKTKPEDEEPTGDASDEETEGTEEDSPEAVAAASDADVDESTDEGSDSDADSDSDEASDSESDSDADSDSDTEEAAAAEPEQPKRKKKRKKKSAAASADAPRKRKKKTAASSSATASPRTPERKKQDDEENIMPLAIGAIVVAIAAVAGLYWWNHRNDAETTEVTIEDVDDGEATGETGAPGGDQHAEKQPPRNPFAQPPRPPQPNAIPAPPDVAAPPADAQRTESGLASKVLEEGEGTAHPGPTDRVTVHYTGWTTDGQMFDSSVARGRPATFPLNGVIPGWTEGVQLMVQGEKRRFWIPENLAYAGRPGAPQGMLVFDVELLEFEDTPDPPPAPRDVAAPPANAQRTESGIASRVLERGSGTEHPSATSTVTVHYTGWTTDGEMFDSSIPRGEPATFPLNRVIPGWTEGVQLMVQGEKRRFWIPEELAYRGRPGRPQGMLVFDIELVEFR